MTNSELYVSLSSDQTVTTSSPWKSKGLPALCKVADKHFDFQGDDLCFNNNKNPGVNSILPT